MSTMSERVPQQQSILKNFPRFRAASEVFATLSWGLRTCGRLRNCYSTRITPRLWYYSTLITNICFSSNTLPYISRKITSARKPLISHLLLYILRLVISVRIQFTLYFLTVANAVHSSLLP